MTRERATERQGGAEVALPTTTDSNRAIASGDVDEVARVLQAQPARRDEILGQLHQSRGNAFVGQVLAAAGNAASHEQRHQEQARGSFEPGDQSANPEAGLFWQRQGGVGGGFSETKNSADTSKKDRRPESERRAEQSDNATYHAMNSQLKLLAYELDAAGKKLGFDIAVGNADKAPDKAQVKGTNDRIMVTVHRLDAMARDIAKRLDDLNTVKNEPRLTEGAQNLSAALAEFAPVMTEVDAWMVAHKEEAPTWEVVGRSKGILKLVVSDIAPVAKPLNSVEKSPGFVKSESIDAHLDAAIAAAESVAKGNRYHSDRIVLHAKEIAELMVNRAAVTGGLEPRIKTLIGLVDQILVENPFLKPSLDEAIDPIRNLK